MSTWNDLAGSRRWCRVVSFIRNWVGPFDSHLGMAEDDLEETLRTKCPNLPTAVREWYLLAANWQQGGLNLWVRPELLERCDGMIEVLTDTYGANHWSVRVGDLDIDDPPVFTRDVAPDQFAFPSFSECVAGMIINDVLFAEGTIGEGDDPSDEVVDLDRAPALAAVTCLVSSRHGDFLGDAPLESATVVMFAYPENGPVSGKSRTPSGRALLERFRLATP